ncbi:PTS sugar transporter subunit IIA [Serpentinimonas barnesii]|uniref:PTS sugar transporter subunit IIA n=1 Tax=Serpentinimonas barnesii TaxID=1458427 RepID=UPI0004972EE4|nr:PTS fructose transporter subunit IIA [Serpentinimonas barnesii]
MNGIIVIAHAPLASALRQCVLHVFPDADDCLQALDVAAQQAPEESLAQLQQLLRRHGARPHLLLTDIVGATPCNVASQVADGVRTRLLAGVNLPMLLRAVSYRHEPLEALCARALQGGTLGVMALPSIPAQALQRPTPNASHAQNHRDHQQ